MGPRGKSKGCRRVRAATGGKRAKASASRQSRPSPQELLEEANALAAVGNTAAAVSATLSAVSGADDSAEVQEAAGVQLLELGEVSQARACLLRSAALSPASGHVKFVYLAQLHSGEEALKFLDAGIAVLQAAVGDSEAADDLSAAWCARCELFLTDLCDCPEAETNCESALAAALSLRPDSAEALQLRAGLRLLRGRRQEALDDMRRSLGRWLPPLRDGRLGDADDCGLTFQQRLRAAELLLELGEYQSCLDVLDLLVEEDDELPQVWLLFGLAYQRLGGDSLPAARFHLTRARQLLGDGAEQEQLDAIDDLLRQLPPEEEEEQQEQQQQQQQELLDDSVQEEEEGEEEEEEEEEGDAD